MTQVFEWFLYNLFLRSEANLEVIHFLIQKILPELQQIFQFSFVLLNSTFKNHVFYVIPSIYVHREIPVFVNVDI